jgi:hypothetical protein
MESNRVSSKQTSPEYPGDDIELGETDAAGDHTPEGSNGPNPDVDKERQESFRTYDRLAAQNKDPYRQLSPDERQHVSPFMHEWYHQRYTRLRWKAFTVDQANSGDYAGPLIPPTRSVSPVEASVRNQIYVEYPDSDELGIKLDPETIGSIMVENFEVDDIKILFERLGLIISHQPNLKNGNHLSYEVLLFQPQSYSEISKNNNLIVSDAYRKVQILMKELDQYLKAATA